MPMATGDGHATRIPHVMARIASAAQHANGAHHGQSARRGL